VTGGTSGIGRDLARLFARDDYDVIVCSRDEDHLRETVKELRTLGLGKMSYIVCDLALPDAAHGLTAELKAHGTHVDILVNNAGHGKIEPTLQQDPASIAAIINLNILSLTMLTRLLVPQMLLRGYGKVLNVASIAAYFPGPFQAVYNATKSYVLSFNDALAIELKNTPVSVTAMCPGVTQTDFFNKAGVDSDKVFNTPGMTMSSEETALEGYKALFRGDMQYICGTKNWLMVKMFNITPAQWSARIASALNRSWV